MDDPSIKPGRWMYGMAVLVAVAGAVLFVIFLVTRLNALTAGFIQVLAPGTTSIDLGETGTYTVFHEYVSLKDGKVYSTGQGIGGLRCIVVEKATGSEVAIAPTRTNASYSVGGRSGVAVFEFEVARPGVYEFSASYPERHGGPETVFAIGRGFTRRLLTAILGSFAILGGTAILSLAIVLYAFLRRRGAGKGRAPAPR